MGKQLGIVIIGHGACQLEIQRAMELAHKHDVKLVTAKQAEELETETKKE